MSWPNVSSYIRLAKPMVGDEELRAIKRVLDSGFLTEGPVTAEFERKVASYLGCKYAIATTSCSTALELALRTLGIKKGDEIIAPDFTYPITASVAYLVGAEPVLVDVYPDTYCMNMQEVEEAISERTKAVIPVSLFGHPINLEPLMKLQKKYGFVIIEDAACSFGASYKGKMTGSIADVTCFSFHPRKIITTGEGGMLTTNNDEIKAKAASLKKFGMVTTPDEKIVFMYPGTNYKMSDILAAIGIVQLSKIELMIEDRIKKAHIYNELLADKHYVKVPTVLEGARHIYQTYCIVLKIKGIRDKVIEKMRKMGIETQIGTYCLHIHPLFAHAKKIGSCEVSEYLYNNSIALPLHYALTYEDQKRVVDCLDIAVSETLKTSQHYAPDSILDSNIL
jgi:dTDP-4-amino-4,6-dideoxygalactose transaminase